jgi:tryptophanyl-tRNA synthetase
VYRPELELEKTRKMGFENIKDIIAFGFDPEKTFIFSDCDYI